MAAWRRNSRVSRAVTTLAVLLVSSASAGAATWSVNPVDTGGSVGQYSSLELDADGNPVIAYYDASSDDLLLAHCNDPRCEGGDEAVSAVDTSVAHATPIDKIHPILSQHCQWTAPQTQFAPQPGGT